MLEMELTADNYYEKEKGPPQGGTEGKKAWQSVGRTLGLAGRVVLYLLSS